MPVELPAEVAAALPDMLAAVCANRLRAGR